MNSDAAAYVPLILAAGAGRRIGRPKALLDLDGRSALALCLEACRLAAKRVPLAPPVVVLGHGAGEVLASWPRTAIGPGFAHPVHNPDPDRGRTSSLQAGLAHVSPAAPGILVFPVDQPLVTSDDIVALVRAADAHPDALVVLPSYGGHAGHPALVRTALRPPILALGPDQPLRDLLRAHRTRTIYVERPDPGVIMDIDEPADLEAAIGMLRRRRDKTEPRPPQTLS
ncbi:MAG: nucleotidyltransferase family protein [Chloroflexota bacterium]